MHYYLSKFTWIASVCLSDSQCFGDARVAYWTGKILDSCIIHSSNNLLGALLSYLNHSLLSTRFWAEEWSHTYKMYFLGRSQNMVDKYSFKNTSVQYYIFSLLILNTVFVLIHKFHTYLYLFFSLNSAHIS